MSRLLEDLRTLRGATAARAVLALGIATLWLLLAAIVGALVVANEDDEAGTEVAVGDVGPDEGTSPTTAAGDGATTVPGQPGETTPEPAEPGQAPAPELGDGGSGGDGSAPAGGPGGGGTPGEGGGAAPAGGGGAAGGGQAAPAPGDRTGVSAGEIKFGLHAPRTFDGVPIDLARDPIKGFEAYMKFLNDSGGVNGRKINYRIEDDRFTTSGARTAADRLINDFGAFYVSGTLGTDQVHVVATEAKKRGVPYMAAGTHEPIFSELGMFQLGTSYDTHAIQLARFLAKDAKYKDITRIGLLVSDTPLIFPVADIFRAEIKKTTGGRMQVVSQFNNRKPQDETRYNDMIFQFRRDNVELLIPFTDPLTTQQIVQRCAAGAACGWTYTFSNFAHDSDTAAKLMAPTWGQQRVRGLSGACYYLAAQVDDPAKCSQMLQARDQYIQVHGAEAWEDEGSGAAFGYQLVYFWHKAMVDAGRDLTRERFVAAMRNYDGYANLITGPITFKGTSNIAHGAEKMAVWEVEPNNQRYRMVSDGLLTGF